MEMGRTCVLLNMEQLYESLYDALNQYYAFMGTAKFVDLGLGAHRVKCRVDDNFKLVVIATKQLAYKFPIPLINRLEKHLFSIKTILTEGENQLLGLVEKWAMRFLQANNLEVSGTADLEEDVERPMRTGEMQDQGKNARNRKSFQLTFGTFYIYLLGLLG